MRKFNRFTQGSGCFKCSICERMTRDTGQGVDHLCEDCYEIAGIDNHFNDNGDQSEPAYLKEAVARLAHIKKLGGNVQRVMDSNEYIAWPTENNSEEPVAQVAQVEEVKSAQPAKKANTRRAKMTKTMTKAQKTLNLVAKLDGTIKPGDLVHRIQTMCEFNTERAARTYLHNARKAIKAGKGPAKAAPKKGRKELTRAQKDAKNAARRAKRAAAKNKAPMDMTGIMAA